jgi:hypothetical protein
VVEVEVVLVGRQAEQRRGEQVFTPVPLPGLSVQGGGLVRPAVMAHGVCAVQPMLLA